MTFASLDSIVEYDEPALNAAIALVLAAGEKETYEALLVEMAKKNPVLFGSNTQMLNAGFFGGMHFINLMMNFSSENKTNTIACNALLRKLIESLIIQDQTFLGSVNQHAQFMWNRNYITYLAKLDCIHNLLLTPSALAEKFSRSTFGVLVDKNGDKHLGTCFITSNRTDGTKRFLITAKHNIDKKDGIIFERFHSLSSTPFRPISSDWLPHEALDIAAMPVDCCSSTPNIYTVGQGKTLSRTVTLGYPKVATLSDAYLLAHSGEINAIVKDTNRNEVLIISNYVSPGSSGGPVLDRNGLAVGIVSRELQFRYETGVSSVNAAIPSSEITKFISELEAKW